MLHDFLPFIFARSLVALAFLLFRLSSNYYYLTLPFPFWATLTLSWVSKPVWNFPKKKIHCSCSYAYAPLSQPKLKLYKFTFILCDAYPSAPFWHPAAKTLICEREGDAGISSVAGSASERAHLLSAFLCVKFIVSDNENGGANVSWSQPVLSIDPFVSVPTLSSPLECLSTVFYWNSCIFKSPGHLVAKQPEL